jgi:hypothetical protein
MRLACATLVLITALVIDAFANAQKWAASDGWDQYAGMMTFAWFGVVVFDMIPRKDRDRR